MATLTGTGMLGLEIEAEPSLNRLAAFPTGMGMLELEIDGVASFSFTLPSPGLCFTLPSPCRGSLPLGVAASSFTLLAHGAAPQTAAE